MARVCELWFPKGSVDNQKKAGFYMDDMLKKQLDIMIKNVVNDWDFTLVISAGGEVRVGKSLLAMQIAAYWSYAMWTEHKKKVLFNVDNFVLLADDLIAKGNEMGKTAHYCALVYDEAGEALEGTKSMSTQTRQVTDYLRECGQYNFLNILVLPEFFALPRGIALTRSIALIDVSYTADENGEFQRGYFKFYSRKAKKKLYLNGKKFLNYHAAAHNFQGRFYKFYPIDEKRYREKKVEALQAREVKNINKEKTLLYVLVHYLATKYKVSPKDIAEDIYKEEYSIKIKPGKLNTMVKKVSEQLEARWDADTENREKKDAEKEAE